MIKTIADMLRLKIGDSIPRDGIDDCGVIHSTKRYPSISPTSSYIVYEIYWKKSDTYINYNEEEIIKFLCQSSYFMDFQERIEERLNN